MGRRPIDSNPNRWVVLTLLFVGVSACILAYLVISIVLKPEPRNATLYSENFEYKNSKNSAFEGENGEKCCRGVPNLELWGNAVKWGTEHKLSSSEECCNSCKSMCSGNGGACLCDSWVFCGDPDPCGLHFGECWLKKQKDSLAPQRQDTGSEVKWTSGLIFGKGEGIIGLETEHGTLHVKLRPDCAPYSVEYILELLQLRHCAGCHFYRAESRGDSWDSNGNHIKDTSFGPPYALIQGTLGADGVSFKSIPTEVCPNLKRGAIAWVGSGPEFFISLANHVEWNKAYTVFGYVLPDDMQIAERIALLPTRPDVWGSTNVTVLENPVPISVRRIKSSLDS